MFEYNYKFFPIIYIKIKDTLNRNELTEFCDEWLKCYDRKEYFKFIIEIENVSVNPSSIIFINNFIRKIKKMDPQYLELSIVKGSLANGFVNLMKASFKVVKPVSPFYFLPELDEETLQMLLNREYTKELLKEKNIYAVYN